jgi:hypothetical protein
MVFRDLFDGCMKEHRDAIGGARDGTSKCFDVTLEFVNVLCWSLLFMFFRSDVMSSVD